MDGELQLNTYVLMGNVLNYLLNGVRPGPELAVPMAEILALYAKIEPLKPNQILPGIAALGLEEQELLGRCCRYCLQILDESEAATLLGLPRELAEQVVTELDLS